MRVAADTLRNLADRFEQQGDQAANPPHNQPKNETGEPRP
jgi:hypothetical protein